MRSRLIVVLVSFVFVLSIMSMQCSGCDKEKSKSDKDGEKTTSVKKGGTAETDDAPVTEGKKDEAPKEPTVKDLGDKCRQHEYIVPLGGLYTIRFSKKVGIPEELWIEWKITKNELEGTDVGIFIDDSSMESYYADIWTIDATGLSSEARSQIPVGSTFYSPYGAPRTLVLWKRDGTGILALALNGGPDFEETGKLSEDEVREKLGGLDKLITWTDAEPADVSLYKDELELYAANVDIDIQTPSDMELTTGGLNRDVVLEGNPSGKIKLYFSRLNSRSGWKVVGPAESADCYK